MRVFFHPNIRGLHRVAAVAALQLRFQGFAALAVVANEGGAVLAGQVFVAPLGQMHDHRVEFLAHGGEPVFVAQGASW